MNLIRLSGVAASLAGVLRIIAAFIPNTTTNVEVLYFFTDSFILLALFGLYALLSDGAKQYSVKLWRLSGFLLALLGVALLLANDLLSTGPNFYAAGALIFSIGLSLLAIGAWIANRLPRWIPLFWVFSTVIGIIGFFVPGANLLFVIAGLLFGASFIWAGIEIWRAGNRTPISA